MYSSDFGELLEGCFQIDPAKRLAAYQALKMPFFQLDSDKVNAEMRELCDMAFLDTALENFGL